jgi:hypothetical protein
MDKALWPELYQSDLREDSVPTGTIKETTFLIKLELMEQLRMTLLCPSHTSGSGRALYLLQVRIV